MPSPDHAAVLTICAVPMSVAEVAGRLGLPLGVGRGLVGDLVAAGTLRVHGSAGVPDQTLPTRVLDGLRRP